MEFSRPLCLFLVSFVLLATSACANIAVFDEYWQQRAKEAREFALAAYKHAPVNVTNDMIYQAMKKNSTGRALQQVSGHQCKITNPIDRCWRCDPNWANDRQKLATCSKGFGRRARGGMGGQYYVVTDSSDDDVANPKYGTLRHAVGLPEPLWITFASDMTITFKQEVLVNSYKTIDGRGAEVHISNGGSLVIQFVHDVIIHNIHIHDIIRTPGGNISTSPDHVGFRRPSEGDGISLFGASNIWIDHVTMSNCDDGLIDAVDASTAITISNSYFSNHNYVILLGASDYHKQDKVLQATVAFNHFGNDLGQRMPRVRFGFAQVLNNDYDHCIQYCVGGSKNPTIISQGNRYTKKTVADLFEDTNKEVTRRQYTPKFIWKNWNWKSDMDVFVNKAFFIESGRSTLAQVSNRLRRGDLIRPRHGNFVPRLTRFAGVLPCKVGKPC